jgi:hypothetical protein
MKSPGKTHLDQLLKLASKNAINSEVVTWLQRKMDEEIVFPPRQVTLEALDRLIQMTSDEVGYHGGTHAEEICELIFGQGDDSGMLLDIVTLARIALVHLRGTSFLVHEVSKQEEPQKSLEELKEELEKVTQQLQSADYSKNTTSLEARREELENEISGREGI